MQAQQAKRQSKQSQQSKQSKAGMQGPMIRTLMEYNPSVASDRESLGLLMFDVSLFSFLSLRTIHLSTRLPNENRLRIRTSTRWNDPEPPPPDFYDGLRTNTRPNSRQPTGIATPSHPQLIHRHTDTRTAAVQSTPNPILVLVLVRYNNQQHVRTSTYVLLLIVTLGSTHELAQQHQHCCSILHITLSTCFLVYTGIPQVHGEST